jgi:hypothetical protein
MRSLVCVICLLATHCATAGGQPAAPADEGFTPSPEFQEWLTALVREHIPHEYEKRNNWGSTTRVASGLSVRFDDGQIKTHRKFRDANDGRWTMYRVELIDPQEKFAVRVLRMEELPDGRVGMNLEAVARVRILGRQSLWERGVQIFSISAEADANVRMTARADVTLRLNPISFPPDVHLKPRIVSAQLDLPDFRLRRVGQLDGPLVRSLSHQTRETLEAKLADDNRELVEKLNQQLARQDGKLKLSLADLMKTRFGGMVEKSLGGESSASAGTSRKP